MKRRSFRDVKMTRELSAIGVMVLLVYLMLTDHDTVPVALPSMLTVLGGWLDLLSADSGRRRHPHKRAAKA